MVFRWLPSKSLLLLVIGAVAAFSVVACGGDDGESTVTPTTTPDGAPPQFVMSDVPRHASEASAVASVGSASEAFAADLYQGLAAQHDGNIVFSPYSAAVALAMTLNGARGQTAAEMESVLHADLAGDLNAGFNAIDQALASVPGEYDVGGDQPVTVELATANQLWGQDGFSFRQEFLDELAADYGAGMRLVDYVANTEGARQSINSWVSDQTRERIPELIQQGVLNADTRLVLTNAIYMNAPWRFPFDDGGTESGDFTTLAGDRVAVPMMSLNENLAYASGDGYQAVVLPYADGQLSMMVVVPDEGSFTSVEGRIREVVDEVDGSRSTPQVDLRFPKFEFRTQAGLKAILSELGMPTAFTDQADFSGMTDEARLMIQDVVHEAFISVDEAGTEAAAATAVIVGLTSAPLDRVELTVDRPFLFLIRHEETGAVLFMGRVADPSAS